jgi:glycosyltransferase involved in cell wall biosynthesis
MSVFTVIIPLYNKQDYIINCLESIFTQSFQDFEILVVDDCSTDSSLRLVKEWSKKPVSIIQHAVNEGLASTRNTGIQNATTEYVTFLDADDVWLPNFLESIFGLINTYPEARIFATNYYEKWFDKLIIPHNNTHQFQDDFTGIIPFFKLNLQQGIYNHGSVCLHKEVYEKVGFYNPQIKFSQDIDFNIRANLAFKLAYANTRQMIYFMQTENQITRKKVSFDGYPDYDKYESFSTENPDLKKYLDFTRYVLAKKQKRDGYPAWKKTLSLVNKSNLNWKQKVLLKLPTSVLNWIDRIKLFLLKNNIKISTYSK